MLIAFSEHMHWVYARDPLKDPVELAGAAACFGGLMADVLGWEAPSSCLAHGRTLSLGGRSALEDPMTVVPVLTQTLHP